jgi:hypothetical protein
MIIDNENGLPISLTFQINWHDSQLAFCLPCNFQGVKKAVLKNTKVSRNSCTDEQALRVGWRIIKDWVLAQLAIVEAELASLAEVFIPYAVTKSGSTLYKMLENDSKLLIN